MVLISPLISDKTVGMNADKKYVFWIKLNATKNRVQTAVESMYEVNVKSVNIINVKGKKKRNRRGHIGKRSNKKKAIVTLKEGVIDFNKRGV